MKYLITLCALLVFVTCARKPNPFPSVTTFEKVNGEPTAKADAGRSRSEGKSFVVSPRFPTVYFDFDSDKIKPEYQDKLSNVIRDVGVTWVCHVDGFASSEGTEAYNLALGARRASRVGDYIGTSKGITVVEVSYGEERQKETPELSRRVEVSCE
jgi:outer membrane protein OmpA-like peptidoglycan-associated protein